MAGLAAARGFERLSGRLTFTPDAEHGRYIYTGEATYGRLLNGVIPTVARPMVPPGESNQANTVPFEGLICAA